MNKPIIQVKPIFAAILLFSIISINTYAQHSLDVNRFGSNTRVIDMVAIYYGTESNRLNWDIEAWTPYVVHTFQNGERKWLFQGFSLIELRMDKKSFVHSKITEPATQNEWKKLIELLFIDGKCLDALDKTIEKYRGELGASPFRHKIVVSIPSPVKGQLNWGMINGKRMNFARDEDRITAVKWFINEFLSSYKKHHYDNFDLEGFTWTEEDMEQTPGLVVKISNYIHQLGYKHYWNPYLKAKGSTYWDEYNFDYCYLQAGGYCINADHGFDRVEQALTKAKKRGMGLVFELDSHLFADPNTFIPRINKCIDYFEQKKIYDNVSMTYYVGASTIYAIYKGQYNKKSITPGYLTNLRMMLDRIAEHIVTRYTNVLGSYPPLLNTPSSSKSTLPAPDSNIDDWRNPEYWHF